MWIDRVLSSRFHSLIIWACVFALLGPVFTYFALEEGPWRIVAHASAITLALWLMLAMVLRRFLSAAVLVTGFVGFVILVSAAKRSVDQIVFHAYDIVFYLTHLPSLLEIWDSHKVWMLGGIAILLVTSVLSHVSAAMERPIKQRRTLGVVFFLTTAIAATIAATKEERRHTQFYWEDRYLSSFYSSWVETLEALFKGELVEAAQASQRPALTPMKACPLQDKPPHIILIHLESVFAPSLFPQLNYNKQLDRFFQSDDGKSHQLRVETFGGASWLTEFSVMTGLSTRAFGGMRGFVHTYMLNRIGDTLPQVLSQCGYRNALFYPMLKSFISTAPFYRSVGIPEIYDAQDQKAPSVYVPDRFYYNNALAHIEAHLAKSKTPTFTFIETMFTHWPYNEPLEPQDVVPGGGDGPGSEMHEYLRRLWISHRDFEELKKSLASKFPGERFLLVGYGDHHPTVTQPLLGIPADRDAEDVKIPANSPGYITPFMMQGVGFEPQSLPLSEPVDVAYLPSLILQAAKLPLPPSHAERLNMMKTCRGLYFTCARQDEVRDFHRRLIDAGLLKPR